MFFRRILPNNQVIKVINVFKSPWDVVASKRSNLPSNLGGLKTRFEKRLFTTSTSVFCETGMAAGGLSENKNRLASERSPYLLQHASNPVDWYPWGEEAFAKARAEDKIIFLSVGYSTCHWCHVMERESFEDPSVASIMNEYFVNIKVDREERPDVDKIYMTFVQATSGGGGWPMSVFLTPDLKPVAGGTYFPPKDSFGRPGFKTILLNVAKQWMEQRAKVTSTSNKITELLRDTSSFDIGLASRLAAGEVPGSDVWKLCLSQLEESYEPTFGGFSEAPKFPQPGNLVFLFHTVARDPKSDAAEKAKRMILHTLDKMSDGGIHDHISRGFARYSTDRRWHVPHFEKMLYDQAQLTVAFLNAYSLTKEVKYVTVVHDILEYVSRDLSHPAGGFYSAEDADSFPSTDSTHKREGAFCVWTFEEILKHLDKPVGPDSDVKLYQIFNEYYSVSPAGNVSPANDPHEELRGQNVLMIGCEIMDLVTKFNLPYDLIRRSLDNARKILFDVRRLRPRPHLDDKIITAWNGLMISGYAQAAFVLNNENYKNRAIAAATFVKNHLFNEKGRLFRSCYTSGSTVVQLSHPIEGFLDDYACLIRGLIDLYECTFNEAWLLFADRLQQTQDELFWDHGLAGYFSTPSGDNNIIFRLKEDQDGAEPSGNSVAAENLLRLAAFLDNPDYNNKAAKIFSSYSGRLNRLPLALPEMTSALMFYHDHPTQIVVTGTPNDNETQALVDVIRNSFIPGLVLVVTEDGSNNFISSRNASIRKMKKVGNHQAAYVCRGRACSLPVSTPADLAALLQAS